MTEWKESLKMSENTTDTGRESGLLSALGLGARARKLIYGVPMICEALRKGGKNAPIIVLESSDTSENTHKKISDKCSYYNTRLVRLNSTGEELAAALGKTSSLAAVAVTDENICRLVEKNIRP